MAVARHGHTVTLSTSDEFRNRISQGREALERKLAAGEVVYGVNTGFGGNSRYVIPSDELAHHQQNLLEFRKQLFAVDELAQAPAKSQRCRVDRDVDIRGARGRKALLDGIENDAIFFEGAAHAVGHLPRGLRIVGQNIAHLKPVIARAARVDRRQKIVRVHDERGLTAFRVPVAGTCGPVPPPDP